MIDFVSLRPSPLLSGAPIHDSSRNRVKSDGANLWIGSG